MLFLTEGRVKKNVKKIIYEAELSAPELGVYSPKVLKFFSLELKEKDKKVASVLLSLSRKLEKNIPKYVAYKEYIDPDIQTFLENSERLKVPPESIFKFYVPYKELGEETTASIKKKLYVPLVIFSVVTMMLGGIMQNFVKMAEDGGGIIHFPAPLMFALQHFYLINFAIGGTLAYFLIVKTETAPFVKRIFDKLKAMNGFATIMLMYEMGYPPGDIFKILAKQYPLKNFKGGRRNDLNTLLRYIKELKFIDDFESAKLKLLPAGDEVVSGFEKILHKKEREIKDLDFVVNSVIQTVSTMLLIPPLLITVLAILALMTSASNIPTT